MPAAISCSIVVGSQLAGPIVAMILVRRPTWTPLAAARIRLHRLTVGDRQARGNLASVTTATEPNAHPVDELVGQAPPSPAGPIEPAELDRLPAPPQVPLPRLLQSLRFNQRQIEFVFRARRELGEVFRMRGATGGPGRSPATPTTCARSSPPSPSRRRR